jgi:Na+-translocating ferredoxin:NAD+ oxidoreductase RnfG subunit
MSTRNTLILLVLVAAASAGITRYYFPQVEFRNTETVKEVIRNDIRTIVKEVVRPDGTKEIITETTDKSVKKESSTSETLLMAKKQWMFGVGAAAKLSDRDVIVYDLHVQRRILGPFFLGARAATDKSVGVSIGMEF